ncbi:MAG: hypothetical protein M3Y07_05460, partial [Acidobacteriota bacterium]|nr:hypothetical protein [Acidobacteriota bacterium]
MAFATSGLLGTISAQGPSDLRPDWRKIGSFAVDLQLASPVTGPVDAVWFSPEGDRLFARTYAGRILETTDFETWTNSTSPAAPPDLSSTPAVKHPPESRATLQTAPSDPQSVYALGSHLYRSWDGGRTWTNLTGYGDRSVIGANQHGLAISPRDPRQIVVANDFGVWRSLDGGLSWTGLNQRLPNLPARSILSTVRSGKGIRIAIDGMGIAELLPGGSIARQTWTPVEDSEAQSEAATRARVSQAVNANVTVLASSGDIAYAGADDGRLWVSTDRGVIWNESPQRAGGAIERIFVDPEAPRVALAAAAGAGTHLLRTTNTGLFWDDVTGNLPDVPAHGVTADRAAGA